MRHLQKLNFRVVQILGGIAFLLALLLLSSCAEPDPAPSRSTSERVIPARLVLNPFVGGRVVSGKIVDGVVQNASITAKSLVSDELIFDADGNAMQTLSDSQGRFSLPLTLSRELDKLPLLIQSQGGQDAGFGFSPLVPVPQPLTLANVVSFQLPDIEEANIDGSEQVEILLTPLTTMIVHRLRPDPFSFSAATIENLQADLASRTDLSAGEIVADPTLNSNTAQVTQLLLTLTRLLGYLNSAPSPAPSTETTQTAQQELAPDILIKDWATSTDKLTQLNSETNLYTLPSEVITNTLTRLLPDNSALRFKSSIFFPQAQSTLSRLTLHFANQVISAENSDFGLQNQSILNLEVQNENLRRIILAYNLITPHEGDLKATQVNLILSDLFSQISTIEKPLQDKASSDFETKTILELNAERDQYLAFSEVLNTSVLLTNPFLLNENSILFQVIQEQANDTYKDNLALQTWHSIYQSKYKAALKSLTLVNNETGLIAAPDSEQLKIITTRMEILGDLIKYLVNSTYTQSLYDQFVVFGDTTLSKRIVQAAADAVVVNLDSYLDQVAENGLSDSLLREISAGEGQMLSNLALFSAQISKTVANILIKLPEVDFYGVFDSEELYPNVLTKLNLVSLIKEQGQLDVFTSTLEESQLTDLQLQLESQTLLTIDPSYVEPVIEVPVEEVIEEEVIEEEVPTEEIVEEILTVTWIPRNHGEDQTTQISQTTPITQTTQFTQTTQTTKSPRHVLRRLLRKNLPAQQLASSPWRP